MTLFKALIIGSALAVTSAALACSSYDCKRKAALSDTSLTQRVRDELKVYYEKSEELYQSAKKERDELKNKLSTEAREALAKHHKRSKKQHKNTAKHEEQSSSKGE